MATAFLIISYSISKISFNKHFLQDHTFPFQRKEMKILNDISGYVEAGEMIALKRISNDPYQCTTISHDVHEVANLEKKVPIEWLNEDFTDMRDEFLSYARPLIQAELTPVYIEGLPRHIYLP